MQSNLDFLVLYVEIITGSSANAVLHGANCDALVVRITETAP